MNIECTKKQGITTVVLKESRLDAVNASELKQSIIRSIDASPSNIILDMSKLTFMDSTGLSVLIFIEKQMRFHDQEWVIFGASCSIVEFLELTRMDQVFLLMFDLDSAKKLLMKQQANCV